MAKIYNKQANRLAIAFHCRICKLILARKKNIKQQKHKVFKKRENRIKDKKNQKNRKNYNKTVNEIKIYN